MEVLDNFVKYNTPGSYYNLALYYYNRKQYASAITFFLQCADKNEDDEKVYLSLAHVALCLANLGRREASLEDLLLYISAKFKKKAGPYHQLSKLYERQGRWIQSYAAASTACELHDSEDLLTEGFNASWFQQGVAAWWIGQLEEARNTMFIVYKSTNSSETHKDAALRNLQSIGWPREINSYKGSVGLKTSFSGANLFTNNNAQSMQDIFVISALDGKRLGRFVEIGSGDPEYCNNTKLLEDKYGWLGIAFDIDAALVSKYNLLRKSICYLQDATTITSDNLSYYDIDYLQVDCEPPEVSFRALKNIFDNNLLLPKVITFEHDAYTGPEGERIRKESRIYLENKGYDLVVPNVCSEPGRPFEDWWIHRSIEHAMPFSTNETIMPREYFYVQ